MEPKSQRTPPEQPWPAQPRAPRKRFRIRKLEERIAPKQGGIQKKNLTWLCDINDTALCDTLTTR
jgi:hypothetical protein